MHSMISYFLPKTRGELERYLKLSQKIDKIKDQQKLVDGGIWSAGTAELFELRVKELDNLKEEYIEILKGK
jgi:hypothetical protein